MKYTYLKKVRHAWNHRHEPECALFLADTLWRAVLCTLVASIVFFAAYGIWTLFSTGADASTVVRPRAAETVSREALDDVLEAFDRRVQRYELLKERPPSLVDPR